MGPANTSDVRGVEEGKMIDCEYAPECAPPKFARKVHGKGREPPSANKEFMSTYQVAFALGSILLNYGVFSIPQAFVKAGLLGGSVAVLLVAGMSIVTAEQLGSVFAELRGRGETRLDYASAAAEAGGPVLAHFMYSWCLLELSMYLVGSLIIGFQTWQTLGIEYGPALVIGVMCAIACLMAALSNQMQAMICSSGALAIVLACGTVLVTGWALPVRAEFTTLTSTPQASLLALPIAAFTCTAHPVLPSFFLSMDSKKSFDAACRMAWMGWAVLVAAFCAVTCHFFGPSLKDVVLGNVGRDVHMALIHKGGELMGLMAFMVILRTQCTLTMLTRPITEALARACGVTLRKSRSGLREVGLAIPIFFIFGFVAVVFAEAILRVENLCGAFLMGINGFLFPAFAYLRVCRPTGMAKLRAYVAIAFGLVMISAPGLSALLTHVAAMRTVGPLASTALVATASRRLHPKLTLHTGKISMWGY